MSRPLVQRWRSWVTSLGLLAIGLANFPAQAQPAGSYSGDAGLGVYRIDTPAGQPQSATVFPYLYGDWGSLYARVDTFGLKTMPMGYGHLELSARISFEGYHPVQSGLAARSSPRLLGLGTFQETPIGGFFLYGFHDMVSGGAMWDATYAAEFNVGHLTLYPQVGLTHRSQAYVQHLYGVSAAETGTSGVPAYQANASNIPNAGLAMEWVLDERYKLVGEVKRRWLDRAVTASPLVHRSTQNSVLLALTRTF